MLSSFCLAWPYAPASGIQNGRADLHPVAPACPSQSYTPLPFVVEHGPASKTAAIIIRSVVPACRSPSWLDLWTIAVLSWKEGVGKVIGSLLETPGEEEAKREL